MFDVEESVLFLLGVRMRVRVGEGLWCRDWLDVYCTGTVCIGAGRVLAGKQAQAR